MSSVRVPGSDGDPRSPLWIVGRDYGETEQRLGLPFQGVAGRVLDRALGTAGLRREDCFITNVVSKRPAGNRWDMHTPATIAEGVEALKALLWEHRPRVVVPLGNEAFRTVIGGNPDADLPPITEARGYIWDGWWEARTVVGTSPQQGPAPSGSPAHVVPAIHPAAALREWVPARLLLDLDLKRAASELREGCPPFPVREVRFVVDEVEAILVEAALAKASRLAVDIENFDPKRLACVGFAASASVAWVVPAYAPWQLALIKRLCESDVPKVLQNGAYDRYFLRSRCGIELRGQEFDTLLAWHCLQPELAGQAQGKKNKRSEKSLRFLASIFCRAPWWKEYSFEDESERWRLCGLDCCLTFEIAERLGAELERVA